MFGGGIRIINGINKEVQRLRLDRPLDLDLKRLLSICGDILGLVTDHVALGLALYLDAQLHCGVLVVLHRKFKRIADANDVLDGGVDIYVGLALYPGVAHGHGRFIVGVAHGILIIFIKGELGLAHHHTIAAGNGLRAGGHGGVVLLIPLGRGDGDAACRDPSGGVSGVEEHRHLVGVLFRIHSKAHHGRLARGQDNVHLGRIVGRHRIAAIHRYGSGLHGVDLIVAHLADHLETELGLVGGVVVGHGKHHALGVSEINAADAAAVPLIPLLSVGDGHSAISLGNGIHPPAVETAQIPFSGWIGEGGAGIGHHRLGFPTDDVL